MGSGYLIANHNFLADSVLPARIRAGILAHTLTMPAARNPVQLMENNPPRRAARLQLKQFLPVQDKGNALMIGRMVDLSVTGMMLICKQEIPAGRTLTVEITTPDGHAVPSICLEAEAVWCRVNPNNTAHYGVGFRFCDVSPQTLSLLTQLMNEPGILH